MNFALPARKSPRKPLSVVQCFCGDWGGKSKSHPGAPVVRFWRIIGRMAAGGRRAAGGFFDDGRKDGYTNAIFALMCVEIISVSAI